MVAIVRTEWSGTSGGPGLTQMAFSGGFNDIWDQAQTNAATSAVRNFWDTIKGLLPDELRLQVSPTVDIYSGTTAELISSFTAGTAPAPVLGTSASVYAGGSGVKLNWNTDTIAFGRRIKGHSYIVPIAGTVFTATGTPSASVTSSINTAASTMLAAVSTASCPMVVWSRPKVIPTPRDGFQSVVTSGTLGAKSAILRGRRD